MSILWLMVVGHIRGTLDPDPSSWQPMEMVSTLMGQASLLTPLRCVTASADTFELFQNLFSLLKKPYLCPKVQAGLSWVGNPDDEEELPIAAGGQLTLEQVCVKLHSPGDQSLLREHEGGLWGAAGELGEEASAEEGGQQGGDQDVDEGEHDARRAVGIGVNPSLYD